MATGTLTISTDLMNSWLLKRLRSTSSPLARTSEAVASSAVSSKEKEIVENQEENNQGVRVIAMLEGESIRYMLTMEDNSKGDDEVFDLSGCTLYMDKQSLPYLEEATIDYKDDLHGSGFVITNPKYPQSGCGCGGNGGGGCGGGGGNCGCSH